MKAFRFTLAATAASLMLVAGVASACGEKASATTASATTASATTASKAKSDCASKASATTVSTGKSGCAKSASKAGCAKSAGATTASNTGCAKSAAKGCCAKAQTTTAQIGETSDIKTCTFRPGAVAFKGTVICNHCDLKKAETCQSMFRTDGGCVFTLAGDNVGDLREEAGGGKKLVRIKGSVSDSGELTVSTYRVVKSLEAASAL